MSGLKLQQSHGPSIEAALDVMLESGALQPYLDDAALAGVSRSTRQSYLGHLSRTERLARLLAKKLGAPDAMLEGKAAAVIDVMGAEAAHLGSALDLIGHIKHRRPKGLPQALSIPQANALIAGMVAIKKDIPVAAAEQLMHAYDHAHRLERRAERIYCVWQSNLRVAQCLALPPARLFDRYERDRLERTPTGPRQRRGMLATLALGFAVNGCILPVILPAVATAKILSQLQIFVWPTREEKANYFLLCCTSTHWLR